MMNNDSTDFGQQKPASRFPANLILVVIGAILIITAVVFYPDASLRMNRQLDEEVMLTSSPEESTAEKATPTPTPAPTARQEYTPTPEIFANTSQFGILVLSIREGKDAHLFVYQPFLDNENGSGYSALPITRITSGPHQDIAPSISPDGTKIAFSSNRDGPWDIYIFNLLSGEIRRYTETQAYDGNPTWSPDGKWLAYESYQINNLDILIQDLDQTSGPISLTNHPAADYAPNWSGQGRKISFISTRNGSQEIWYADLDSPQDDKAVRVPGLPGMEIKHPTWTADGRYLTWSVVTYEGNHTLLTWDSTHPELDPILTGSGDWPLWSGGGEILYTALNNPYDTYLTAYPGFQDQNQVMMPAVKLPGSLEGISWAKQISLAALPDDDPDLKPTPLWKPAPHQEDSSSDTKDKLIQLRNLDAPSPYFIQDALSTFSPLRQETRNLAGWDFLSTLENAYTPLDKPIEPGVNLDWLFTGRGMTINDIPRLAGWLVVLKEDFGDQTFWRVYIRTSDQQGLQGKPLQRYPWDFNARYSGNNADYENGGSIAQTIPAGYWLDFTELAAAYGWKRFPSETYWQFSESASRYQYFAFTQDLSLRTALLQLYPLESIQGLGKSANP